MFNCEKQQDKYRLSIDGEMTIYNAAALKDKLAEVLDDAQDLEIDLANVSEIDSAGVQLLMLARKERDRRGHGLSLSQHSSAVLDAFELMGLFTYFNDPVVLSGKQGGPRES